MSKCYYFLYFPYASGTIIRLPSKSIWKRHPELQTHGMKQTTKYCEPNRLVARIEAHLTNDITNYYSEQSKNSATHAIDKTNHEITHLLSSKIMARFFPYGQYLFLWFFKYRIACRTGSRWGGSIKRHTGSSSGSKEFSDLCSQTAGRHRRRLSLRASFAPRYRPGDTEEEKQENGWAEEQWLPNTHHHTCVDTYGSCFFIDPHRSGRRRRDKKKWSKGPCWQVFGRKLHGPVSVSRLVTAHGCVTERQWES